MQRTNELEEAALSYAAKGWHVVLLHGIVSGKCTCGSGECGSPGKHPRTKNGVKDATLDRATITRWFAKWPDSNVGIATGATSGIVVLDIDPRNGGDSSLAELIAAHGSLPDTYEVTTGGDGTHRYYRYPSSGARSQKLADGIDFQSDGKYVVAPPSRHASEGSYAAGSDVPTGDMPNWLKSLVAGDAPSPRTSDVRSSPNARSEELFRVGERNQGLASLAGSMRQRGMNYEAIEAALYVVNEQQTEEPLSNNEVSRIAQSISRYPPGSLIPSRLRFPIEDAVGRNTGIEIIDAANQQEPCERAYVVDDLVPEQAITILYGDGGVGKSILAVYMGTCVAGGLPALGLGVQRGSVLYVDAELDQQEFLRRAYRVARGLGLSVPPAGLSYVRLNGSLRSPGSLAALTEEISSRKPTLVILDSIMAAAAGLDLERAAEATELMTAIQRWGTVLVLDHVAKPQPGAGTSHLRPFGSTFKHNLARSTVYMTPITGGFTLQQRKNNFGHVTPSMHVEVKHGTSDVVFRTTGTISTTNVDSLARIEEYLRSNGSKTPQQLESALQVPIATVRNKLTKLRTAGRVARLGKGLWGIAEQGLPAEDGPNFFLMAPYAFAVFRGRRRAH